VLWLCDLGQVSCHPCTSVSTPVQRWGFLRPCHTLLLKPCEKRNSSFLLWLSGGLTSWEPRSLPGSQHPRPHLVQLVLVSLPSPSLWKESEGRKSGKNAHPPLGTPGGPGLFVCLYELGTTVPDRAAHTHTPVIKRKAPRILLLWCTDWSLSLQISVEGQMHTSSTFCRNGTLRPFCLLSSLRTCCGSTQEQRHHSSSNHRARPHAACGTRGHNLVTQVP
jgi:hypothetical protein